MSSMNPTQSTSEFFDAAERLNPSIIIDRDSSASDSPSLQKNCDKDRYDGVIADQHRPVFTVGESRKNSCSSVIDNAVETPPLNMKQKSITVAEIQADLANLGPLDLNDRKNLCRTLVNLREMLRNEPVDAWKEMTDEELVTLMNDGSLKQQDLEKKLGDERRAVAVRRLWLSEQIKCEDKMHSLPFEQYDYSMVSGACCENVIGYVPVPVGYAGPLSLNGRRVYVPMATTEGCLVASTNRGCRAIADGAGVAASVYNDGMSRAPVVQFESALEALKVKAWLETSSNYQIVKQKFDSTSGYARLQELKCTPAGRLLYLRFVATTGDAMGMNMVSKATDEVMVMLQQTFVNMELISLSGNYCVDKKASALNWIEGRGKSVVAEAVIPSDSVSRILKTNVDRMVELGEKKLLIGSSMAGVIGGFNAQAANVVAAIFLATGQDAAQVVSSSMCLTQMDKTAAGDLRISCTMPCLEIGTRGGGTILPAQRTCLEMLGCAGGHPTKPGKNAHILAETICATVLAGELSLLAAQCSGDLVKSHLKMNRSQLNLMSTVSEPAVALKDQCTVPKVGSHERRHPASAVNNAFKLSGCANIV
uniref:3-hydroxy-3-methylglutaryl coenzyme A reductase n=1 Tax=Plectus sambesii TaxID=2011161 RepID=A0A914WB57_9BILA